jgi:hypothetical protein
MGILDTNEKISDFAKQDAERNTPEAIAARRQDLYDQVNREN